jgi:hypothetical protein
MQEEGKEKIEKETKKKRIDALVLTVPLNSLRKTKLFVAEIIARQA